MTARGARIRSSGRISNPPRGGRGHCCPSGGYCSLVVQSLSCAHHTSVQLWGVVVGVWVGRRPLLRLAVCAPLAVQAGRWVAGPGQGRVEGVGGQRARQQVVVGAQVVSLGRCGAGQAEILVVAAAADAGAGGELRGLTAELPDLNRPKGEYIFTIPRLHRQLISFVMAASILNDLHLVI